MSYFSKASSTWIHCLLFSNRYFIKDHIYLSLWEVFAHSQKFLNTKERRLNHKIVNSGLNSILQGWGVTAWVGEGGVVFNLIWESIKSWDWVWKVKQRKYIRCTDMLEMDLRGQWARYQYSASSYILGDAPAPRLVHGPEEALQGGLLPAHNLHIDIYTFYPDIYPLPEKKSAFLRSQYPSLRKWRWLHPCNNTFIPVFGDFSGW